MALLEKLLMKRLTVLYSHVLSFYIIDLTPLFYIHIDMFKMAKYFIFRYLTKAFYSSFCM